MFGSCSWTFPAPSTRSSTPSCTAHTRPGCQHWPSSMDQIIPEDRPQRVGLRVPPTGTIGSSSSSDGVYLSVDGVILSDEQILNTDDMALVGCLKDEQSLSQYLACVGELEEWFDRSFLDLNVEKNGGDGLWKSLRRKRWHNPSLPTTPNQGTAGAEAAVFRYLGTVIDGRLSFSAHVNQVYKKAQQRLYLLRRLRSFDVSSGVLETVYRSLVESILSFNIAAWYGHLLVKDKAILARIIHQANKIIGQAQLPLSDLYLHAVRRMAHNIISDLKHPLHTNFQLLPSGRRYKVPRIQGRREPARAPGQTTSPGPLYL
ncbi:hypothetical protein C0Q70_03130 [Pomacea canaliculata]|uniref:Alkylated DNA repair protein AlkB homologue 8 N-terminal domain-containing protein n=1 Tax=Pomacea canaliculata TaxID=400727 RepID=A0A2T7PRV9_POMCA|nr:hypothetical protein C0Q70_03130 [Pomacea canaliculata]